MSYDRIKDDFRTVRRAQDGQDPELEKMFREIESVQAEVLAVLKKRNLSIDKSMAVLAQLQTATIMKLIDEGKVDAAEAARDAYKESCDRTMMITGAMIRARRNKISE